MNKVKKGLLILSSVMLCVPLLLAAGAAADDEGSLPATVTVLPVAKNAVTVLTPGLDADGAAGCVAGIVQVQDAEGKPVAVKIKSYKATLEYNGEPINVLEVRHASAFPGTHTIDNPNGRVEFSGTASEGVPVPCDLAFLTLRLTGTVEQPATVTLTFTEIEICDPEGKTIKQFTPVPTKEFLRGDARADGKVNMRDAVYIWQYLAGLRDIGEGLDKVQPVNAASAKHDGEYDVINFSDAIYILQYVAGWRGPDMEWRRVPPPWRHTQTYPEILK